MQGGAAAEVLKRFFGADEVPFEVCSFTLPRGQSCNEADAVLRSYTSFSQAARDNSLSRIDIHFRRAVNEGSVTDAASGGRAVKLFFTPVK